MILLNFNSVSDEEIKKLANSYIESLPEYEEEQKKLEIKSEYFKKIDKITTENNKINTLLSQIKLLLEEKSYSEVYDLCDKVAILSQSNTQRVRRLPIDFGAKDGISQIKRTIVEKANIQFEYLNYDVLHIILPDLLPIRPRYDSGKKILKQTVNYDYLRSTYLEAFSQEFKNGKYRIKDGRRAVIAFINYYEEDSLIKDHDNLDVKIITDILAEFVLFDDDPLSLSHYMDFDYADFMHTEVYLVPEDVFPNFLIWLKKNKGSRIQTFH